MTKNGWIIGIMIEHARRIRSYSEFGEVLDRKALRAAFDNTQNAMLASSLSEPDDNLESDEFAYVLRRRTNGGPILVARFIGPTGLQIRKIRAERAELNRKAQAARRERAEIARVTKRPGKPKPCQLQSTEPVQKRNRL